MSLAKYDVIASVTMASVFPTRLLEYLGLKEGPPRITVAPSGVHHDNRIH
jgi:hypothetical protein